MYLDPAGSGGHILAMILGSPSLHEGHSDGAHLREFVDGFEAEVDGLGEERGELLVVEDLEAAARRDLADGGGVEAVVVVAVARLDEDGGVTEALGIDFSTDIVEVDALADVSAGVLDGRVPVDVGELPEAEPVVVLVGGVGEPVDDDRLGLGVVDLADPGVELVVGDGGPVGGLLVGHGVGGGVVLHVHFVVRGVGGRRGVGAVGGGRVGG